MTAIDVERLSKIERVNVIGTSGSGKSTFGRELAERLHLPYFELDRVYWGPNWSEPSDEEYFPKIKAITDASRWVLDGNYSRSRDVKWRQVQLIVWLDMSFSRTVFQVTTRSIKRALSKTENWPGTGNRETLRRSFLSRESIILWAITSYARNRKRYSKLMKSPEFDHLWFVRLRSGKEKSSFLEAARLVAENRAGP